MKKPPAARATAKPFLRFHHSRELRVRTTRVLAAVDGAEDPTPHAEELANVVVELTEAGLAYFFTEPLEAAKVGFFLEQTASFGMSGALTMISPVIRTVIGGMDKDQLLVVSAHLRRFMR